ncbi:tyrosine-protein phosphatase [Adhaeretor mobilis]|uniref:Uncharacterized protein n=1 Tax=Adhaeretor mobilis TaxID=1930276 RepID=A0A517N053_9BACT|nr:tyrosine-protein phosphatase [Adhaeretor mobilis]QDT00484.1 hypothetical protein HG15A2_38220 [Adhaeretor mobilis]
MSQTHPSRTAVFSQVDVSAAGVPSESIDSDYVQTDLLREMLAAQDRTNEILEELVSVMSSQQRQRKQELHRWKNANPQLSKSCHDAAESLGRVQQEYLETLTDEINDSADHMVDGEYFLNEFVDRFGPRLAHLNGMIQVLSHLGNNATTLHGES